MTVVFAFLLMIIQCLSAQSRNSIDKSSFIQDSQASTHLPPVFDSLDLVPDAPRVRKSRTIGILALRQQCVRITAGNHGARVRIQEYRIVPNGKNACQFMSHHYNGGAETVP